MTQKYYAYIISTAEIFVTDNFSGELPMLVMSFHYNEKPYKYRTKSPNQADIIKNEWNTITMSYMTPEPRTKNDELGVYFWYRGNNHTYVRNLMITIFEPI